MKKWSIRIAVGLVALVALAFAAGSLLPREHVATSAVMLRQPPDSVWIVVRDLGGTPRWWDEVTASEAVPDTAGREVWRQTVSGFAMALVVVEAVAPSRLVTAIDAPPDAAFGGTWTYSLAPVDGGTRVLVTEAGWIANPLYRLMATLTGLHATLDGYLTALARRFGETATPEHLAR